MTIKQKLWIELLVLFICMPLLLWLFIDELRSLSGGGSFIVIILPVLAIAMSGFLIKKDHLTWKSLKATPQFTVHLRHILTIFILFMMVTSVTILLWQPSQFFIIPKEKPLLWMLILVFYPLLSVLSQGIIYRVFFMNRYKPIFSNEYYLILASAICFSFGHIIFGNLIAPLLTLFGGLLFAWRYQNTKSWLISSFEHALYGCWLFTVGFGKFLFSGNIAV